MALLDIFKKKKKRKKIEKKPAKKPVGKPVEVKPQPTAPTRPKKISGIAARVLKRPHVTERATDLASKNQYVFEVIPESNKIEIKKAIEDIYGVDVVQVRVVNIPRRRRRLGRIEGWRKGYRKAIVKIKEGQKIEVLPR